MASYSRSAVLNGQTIALRAVFTDLAGNLIDPDSLPVVYIYDPEVDGAVIALEMDLGVYPSAFDGPLTPTKISTGFYEVEYTVPLDAELGTYTDLWVSTVADNESFGLMKFFVANGAVITTQSLQDNELIVIELDADIQSYSGLTLGEDVQLSFLTTLKPFYASPDLMRMEIGPWIDFIPDSTLALMIHWSSKEADFIMAGGRSSAKRVQFARAKFVTYDALLRALYLPGSGSYQAGGTSGSGQMTKRLGDLSISSSPGATIATTSSGIDTKTLEYIRSERDEWWRVVNAGAQIMPGQSLGFEAAIRGAYDPDRRNQGRQWADPACFYYPQPGVNSKAVPYGGRKAKHYFAEGSRHGYWWWGCS